MSNDKGGASAMSDEVRPSCWIRPSWRITGVATMQPDCPPGWVAAAKPYYSKEALDEAIAAESKRWRDVVMRMMAGIEHLSEIARQWEPDHSSGADRRGWLLAKDARDDAARMLGPNASGEPTKEAAR